VPVPTRTLVVPYLADANGNTYGETWADGSMWESYPWSWGAPAAVPVHADDGLMGGRWGTLNQGPAFPVLLWDQTQPVTFKYRFRSQFDGNNVYAWEGLGVIYSGEDAYGGVTSEGAGTYLGSGQFGIYGSNIGRGYILPGDVVDVVETWSPSLNQISAKASFNGGAWSSVLTASPKTGSLPWPFTILFENQATEIDVAAFQVAGSAMAGAISQTGWSIGTPTNACWFGAIESAGAVPGGITGKATDGRTGLLELNASNIAASAGIDGTWSWTSTIVAPGVGAGFKELSFIAIQGGVVVTTTPYLKIYVRAANAASGYSPGDLISDALIPGNSTGLVTTATQSSGAQRVSLTSLPTGLNVYLDVQGQTVASLGDRKLQPRLGHWAISLQGLPGTFLLAPASDLSLKTGTPTSALSLAAIASDLSLKAGSPWLRQATSLWASPAPLGLGAGTPFLRWTSKSPFKTPDGRVIPLKAWNGSAWVDVPMRLWNGSQWN
jgi:hypothetical protein